MFQYTITLDKVALQIDELKNRMGHFISLLQVHAGNNVFDVGVRWFRLL
jgi:hypothetical protein